MALLLTQLDIAHSFLDSNSFLLLNLNVGKDIGDSKNRFLGERILVQRFEVEMHLFITFLQHVSDCINVWHVFELIVKQLKFLPFGISEYLRHLMRPLDGISGPHRISPENIDIKRILDILLLDLLIQFVAMNNLLIHAIDVILDISFLIIVLSKVETVKLHVHSNTIPVIFMVVVLISYIFNIIFKKQLPSFGFVDVQCY